MIYTASYFKRQHHHGKLISISYSEPKGFQFHGKLCFFVPSYEIIKGYKDGDTFEGGYVERYREQCRRNFAEIKKWLDNIRPESDQTLLCWEPPGDFCHRNLVIKFVERYRPDCLGGCDLPRFS